MKVSRTLWSLVCFLILGFPLSAFSQPSLDENDFREIYPIPRIGKYQRTIIPVLSKVILTADMAFDREKVQMAAVDVSGYIARRYGKPFSVAVKNGSVQKAGFKIPRKT